MSYGRLKEKEQALSAEIDALIEQAKRCDREEVRPTRNEPAIEKRESQDGSRVYQGSAKVCAGCPLQSRCCQSAKGDARTIQYLN
jgi:hypothetical protein